MDVERWRLLEARRAFCTHPHETAESGEHFSVTKKCAVQLERHAVVPAGHSVAMPWHRRRG